MLKGGLNAVLKWPFPCRNSALHQRQQRQQRHVRTQDSASGSWFGDNTALIQRATVCSAAHQQARGVVE